MFLKTGYFSLEEEQAAYSQHQFDRSQKECMLSTALDFPGDKSHHSVLALEVPGSSQGLLSQWPQSALWKWL